MAAQKCQLCGEMVIVAHSMYSRLTATLDAEPSPLGTAVLRTEAVESWPDGLPLYDTPPMQGRVRPLYTFHRCKVPEENALDVATIEAEA